MLKLIRLTMVSAITIAAALRGQTATDLMDAGHFKRARPLVEARLTANPNDAGANYDMGRLEHAFGDDAAALKHVERAVELDAGKAPFHALLAELLGGVAQHASMFQAMSLSSRMRKEMDAALAIDPKNIEAMGLYMIFYLKAPGMMGGDKSKAYAIADNAVKAVPWRGYLLQVRLANEEKQPEKVEGLLKKAIEANPKGYAAHMSYANYLVGKERFEEGEAEARQAMQLDGSRVAAYGTFAQSYATQKKWTELEAMLQSGVKAVPDDLAPYYRAGRALLTSGVDLPRAEGYFRKYMSQPAEGNQPAIPLAHWSLGLVMEKMGKKPEALAELEQCVKAKPDFEQGKKDLARLKR